MRKGDGKIKEKEEKKGWKGKGRIVKGVGNGKKKRNMEKTQKVKGKGRGSKGKYIWERDDKGDE